MPRDIIPYNPALKALARQLRNNLTHMEARLWNCLKQRQMLGYDFDRQQPLDNYIVDFYCKDLKLAIEIDGSTHDWEEVAESDVVRQERLETLGVQFLRFPNEAVNRDLYGVLRAIQHWIEDHAPVIDPAGYKGKFRGCRKDCR